MPTACLFPLASDLQAVEATGEELLEAVLAAGGSVDYIRRDPFTGVIYELQASAAPAVRAAVLPSLMAGGNGPFTGDLAQTQMTDASGTLRVVIALAEWTLKWTRKSVDTTTVDNDKYDGAAAGPMNWTATAKYMFVDGDPAHTQVLDAIDAVQVSTSTWTFFPTVAAGATAFQGAAFVDSITLATGVGKVVGLDISLKGRGRLQRVTQTAPAGGTGSPGTGTSSSGGSGAGSLVFADTATATLFRIALVGNALTPVPYTGSAAPAPLFLTDTATGTVYAVSVANGAITWTPSPGSAGVSSVPITDDNTGSLYALSMTNDTLTWA